tara:strand:- start:939 stop:1268 length:330 start_codon:yes stop_codon:yes gene_type:complete
MDDKIQHILATYTFPEFIKCPTVNVIGLFENLADWQDEDFYGWKVVDKDDIILAMSDDDDSHTLPSRDWVKVHCMSGWLTGEKNYERKIGKYSVRVSGDSMFIRDTTES